MIDLIRNQHEKGSDDICMVYFGLEPDYLEDMMI
jgi:hypothetical protein